MVWWRGQVGELDRLDTKCINVAFERLHQTQLHKRSKHRAGTVTRSGTLIQHGCEGLTNDRSFHQISGYRFRQAIQGTERAKSIDRYDPAYKAQVASVPVGCVVEQNLIAGLRAMFGRDHVLAA